MPPSLSYASTKTVWLGLAWAPSRWCCPKQGGATTRRHTGPPFTLRLPDGVWTVRVDDPRFLPVSQTVTVRGATVVKLPLLPDLTTVTVDVEATSEATTLAESAQAVHVIDTRAAKGQAADLGTVLARSNGVSVQRTGGLGSDERFSLNGLTDNQVRFFIDGLPLELAGYTFGLSNVPVSFVERAEVYRGVVPIRFGADALGGAVNLVTPERLGVGTSGALAAGSFDTLRATLGFHARGPKLYTQAGAYLDLAENDYPVSVKFPDDQGHPVETTAHRFHDAYQAGGGQIDVGLRGHWGALRVAVPGAHRGRGAGDWISERERSGDVVAEAWGSAGLGGGSGGA